MSRALLNSAAFLQPLADLVGKKYGAAVSIFLCCPMESGRIEVRRSVAVFLCLHISDHSFALNSVNSGVTKDVLPRTWPEFDPEAHSNIGKAMFRFGQHIYSE